MMRSACLASTWLLAVAPTVSAATHATGATAPSAGALVVSAATTPLAVDCPPGALQEGEPACYDGYFDRYNPGCTGDPHVYTELPCSDDTLRVCGEYGRNEYWDLDWYRLTLRTYAVLDLCVQGEGRAQLVVITPTCESPEVMRCNVVAADPNGKACCSPWLPPGDYVVFIRPYHVGSNIPCGSKYLLEIHGNACTDVAAHPLPWTRVKSLYRD